MRFRKTGWVQDAANDRTPTHWVVLCDEHFEHTSRKEPLVFP
jgi:hypothetical protein